MANASSKHSFNKLIFIFVISPQVNHKLETAGKTTSIRNFQDSKIADGKIVIDLVDSIKPGSVNYENVKNGDSEEV